ncbi:CaiB/BaiF CoA-transferase family protein [Neobacillus niacini]|uniref:CaiB/BaiF CoA transferase family protein n=1 Tax=Neobacillus niacini TaxID=86668 RepID=UPI0021CB7266|nr:CaiB/BaiF CoA-transferase family protein [Neobacillus niacini]MCM3764351.1 CoA transferase [Neobacillus niacini]
MPLEGIRVLDLTRLLPGPYCSLMLADFGADVIKIEDPTIGDYARWWEPKIGGLSAMFHSLNRNKRSMSLDLKQDQNREVFVELVRTADVLIESFRPGVMDRLGLGYEELKKHNPKLIYCAITSYGQTGPYKDIPGHDINFLGYSGLLELQGEQNRKPVSSSVQIGDLGGGALMGVVGILVSIIEAQKSGKGQFIDISMLDGSVSWMQTMLPSYLVSGQLPGRGELVLNGGMACYETYETKDHRYLSVGALEMKFWKNFCQVIGKEELINQLNAPPEQQAGMKKEIQAIIETKTLTEWVGLFDGVDACVAPVLTMEEMVNDPQIQHRGMIEEENHPEYGQMRQVANPIKLSRTMVKTVRFAPGLGEHNEEILQELGLLKSTKEK